MTEYSAELTKFFLLGEPENNINKWRKYPREFSLTRDDIPALIQILLENSNENFEEPTSWAAVHAWRALGQLKAKEAIPAFIEVLERDVWEDWGWEDLPIILGWFGIDAIEPVYKFMLKHRANFETGIMFVGTLEEIAKSDEKLLEPIKTIAIELLNEASKNDEGVNGSLINFLIDYKAIEALPVIEKAFTGNFVDTFIVGDWDDVQAEFGLKEPKQRATPPMLEELSKFFMGLDKLDDLDIDEYFDPMLDMPDGFIDPAPDISDEKDFQKKKSKRQMAKKSKQINRQKKKKK